MNSVYAYKLAEACNSAARGGDLIDHGWALVKAMHDAGFIITPIDREPAGFNPHKTLNEMCGHTLPADNAERERVRTIINKTIQEGMACIADELADPSDETVELVIKAVRENPPEENIEYDQGGNKYLDVDYENTARAAIAAVRSAFFNPVENSDVLPSGSLDQTAGR